MRNAIQHSATQRSAHRHSAGRHGASRHSAGRPRYRLLRVILPLFLFVFGCFTPQMEPEQPTAVDAAAANVAILGNPYRLAPGSQASFLVQVRAPYTNQRWPQTPVEVYLNDTSTVTASWSTAGRRGRTGWRR